MPSSVLAVLATIRLFFDQRQRQLPIVPISIGPAPGRRLRAPLGLGCTLR